MSTSPEIKYIQINRLSDNKSLLNFSPDRKAAVSNIREVSGVFISIKKDDVLSNQRQKSQTNSGKWLSFKDKNLVAYAGLFSDNYPDNVAYNVLEAIAAKLNDFEKNLVNEEYTVVFRRNRGWFETFCKENQDVQNASKLAKAQGMVKDVQIIMKKNIEQELIVIDKCQDVDTRTQAFLDDSKLFNKQAEETEKITKKRSNKMKVVLGGILLCIVGVLVIIF